MRLTTSSRLGVLAAILLTLFPALAAAQVVIHVEGQAAEKIRSQLVKSLPEKITAVEPATFTEALGRAAIGDAAMAPDGATALAAELVAAGQKINAQLVVLAMLKPNGRALWVFAVTVEDGGIAQKSYTVRKMITKGKKRRRKKVPGPLNLGGVKQALAPLFREVFPAPSAGGETLAAAPAGGGPATIEEPDPEEDRSRRRRFKLADPELRNAGLSGEPRFYIAGRKLSFLRRGDYLRGVRADAIPMLGINADFYPGVLFDIDAIDWLGVGFRFFSALGLAAHDPDSTADSFETSFWNVEGDIRPRFHLGPVTLTPAVGVGGTTFEFVVPSGSGLVGRTPGVSYVFLRAGADVSVHFAPVSIFASISYVYNFEIGTLGEYFPSHEAMGFGARLGMGFQILDWLELRAGGEYTQISLKFEPEATSVYQALSGTDHVYGGFIGVAFFVPP